MFVSYGFILMTMYFIYVNWIYVDVAFAYEAEQTAKLNSELNFKMKGMLIQYILFRHIHICGISGVWSAWILLRYFSFGMFIIRSFQLCGKSLLSVSLQQQVHVSQSTEAKRSQISWVTVKKSTSSPSHTQHSKYETFHENSFRVISSPHILNTVLGNSGCCQMKCW